MKKIESILRKATEATGDNVYTFADPFIKMIAESAPNYESQPREKAKDIIKLYFDDLQHGGCQSGMVSEFIYHADCKAFYIEHLDDLEEFKQELEEEIGEPIQNRQKLPHYTFMCWLCYEEFCYRLYNHLFEN